MKQNEKKLDNEDERPTTAQQQDHPLVRVGPALKKLRKRAGLVQQDIAERLDVFKGSVSRLEHESSNPTFATVGRYLLATGATVEDFFATLVNPDERSNITRPDETDEHLGLTAEPTDGLYERLVLDLTEIVLTELRQIKVRRRLRGKARH